MLWRALGTIIFAASVARADDTSQTIETLNPTDAITGGDVVPTGSDVSYITYTSTSTVYTTNLPTGSGTIIVPTVSLGEVNATDSTTTTPSYTLLVGGGSTTVPASDTGSSSTTTTPAPTNTQPCNNYVEFCTRQYSNITEVCAHNSPFVKKGNAASNQQLDVTTQLNDGIRMLQGQTHMQNGTLYFCHTTCDLLNAGTVEAYLTKVAAWVKTHPYDVITILLGNGDFVDVSSFVDPILNSGLGPYLYEPPLIPMGINDWPTLSYMILTQKRVVIFMDYKADQSKVPYILDEFSQLWETPFSPTNISFPCTVERPPGLNDDQAKGRLYMANHNLNVLVSISTFSILIPDTAEIGVINGLNGTGSVGLTASQCADKWGRPPNFLLVDYYNLGVPNGSVFEVAALQNNVTYNGTCCGTKSDAPRVSGSPLILMMICSAITIFLLI